MSLKIEIYLPKETIENFTEILQDTILQIGDSISVDFGNKQPEDEFNLENLNSFIIIKDDDLPATENFENEDMYFVIPIGD